MCSSETNGIHCVDATGSTRNSPRPISFRKCIRYLSLKEYFYILSRISYHFVPSNILILLLESQIYSISTLAENGDSGGGVLLGKPSPVETVETFRQPFRAPWRCQSSSIRLDATCFFFPRLHKIVSPGPLFLEFKLKLCHVICKWNPQSCHSKCSVAFWPSSSREGYRVHGVFVRDVFV
jgi:hypothetical protein